MFQEVKDFTDQEKGTEFDEKVDGGWWRDMAVEQAEFKEGRSTSRRGRDVHGCQHVVHRDAPVGDLIWKTEGGIAETIDGMMFAGIQQSERSLTYERHS